MWPKNFKDLSLYLGHGVNSRVVREAVESAERAGHCFERRGHRWGWQYRFHQDDISTIREHLRCTTYRSTLTSKSRGNEKITTLSGKSNAETDALASVSPPEPVTSLRLHLT